MEDHPARLRRRARGGRTGQGGGDPRPALRRGDAGTVLRPPVRQTRTDGWGRRDGPQGDRGRGARLDEGRLPRRHRARRRRPCRRAQPPVRRHSAVERRQAPHAAPVASSTSRSSTTSS